MEELLAVERLLLLLPLRFLQLALLMPPPEELLEEQVQEVV